MGFRGHQKLSDVQLRARDDLRLKITTGQYKAIANPCAICEQGVEPTDQIDKVIAKFDRYGIPIQTVMCNKCGMLRTDSVFRDSDYSDFYKYHYRELYSGTVVATNEFFEEQTIRGKQLRKLISKHIEISGRTIIEVGSRAGGILQGVVGDDAYGIGCDFGFNYLKFAQSKSLGVFQGSINALSDNSADVLIYSHVLEHIANPKNEISEMFRVLKNDGLVVIVVPGVYSIHRHYGGRLSQYLQSAHLHHYTRQHLKKLMGSGGFSEKCGSQGVTAVFLKESNELANVNRGIGLTSWRTNRYLDLMLISRPALSLLLFLYERLIKCLRTMNKVLPLHEFKRN
jgi:SAM-dependent methyltransferase